MSDFFSECLTYHFWRNMISFGVKFHSSGRIVQQIAMKKYCESLFSLAFKWKFLTKNNDLQKSKHDKRTLSFKLTF